MKIIVFILISSLFALFGCQNSGESGTGPDANTASLAVNIIIPVDEVGKSQIFTPQNTNWSITSRADNMPAAAIVLPAGVTSFIVTIRNASHQVVTTGTLTSTGTLNLTVPANEDLSVTVEALGTGQVWLYSGTTYNVMLTVGNTTIVDVVLGPPAPENILGATSDNQVELSWIGLSGGADHHNLYWSYNPGVTTVDNKIVVNGTAYIHEGLTNDTTYYYAISAENAAGESGLSEEGSFTPPYNIPVEAPLAPVINTATYSCDISTGTGSNVIGWDVVSGATSYNIYESGVLAGNSSTTTFNHAGVSDSASYTYTVAAVNSGGESAHSSSNNLTTDICNLIETPSSPSSVGATYFCDFDTGIATNTISWNPVSGATSYNIYTSSGLLDSSSGSPLYHSPVDDITEYTYTVTAVNARGESDFNSFDVITTDTCFIEICDPFDPYSYCYDPYL